MDASTPPGSSLRIGLASALLGLCALGLYMTPPAAPRYMMVDEVVAHAADLDGARLRIHGWVHAGSIHRISPDLTTFELQRDGAKVLVWHAGPVPDTLKDQSEIVAYGTLRGEFFEAEQLLAKCATKYDGNPKPDLSTVYK
jgi:cytochrome c-type biogenesis protein CcmE